MNGTAVGLVVDTEKEVVNIPESNIELPPEMAEVSTHHYISGLGKIGDEVKILLDVERLVRKEDAGAVRSIAGYAPGTEATAAATV